MNNIEEVNDIYVGNIEEAKKFLKKKITVNDAVIKEARKNGDLNTIELTNDLDTESKSIETILQALDNSISKDKVKEKIEETDLKINNLKTEISKTLKENEEAGTETEIDINEQYIECLEIELERLEFPYEIKDQEFKKNFRRTIIGGII